MNKKNLNLILVGILMLCSTSFFVSCKDYDDDIDNLQEQITQNKSAIDKINAMINSGSVITNVEAIQDGIKITLSNGQAYNITNGKDGAAHLWEIGQDGYWYKNGSKTTHKAKGDKGDKGQDGQAGQDGKDGQAGQDGMHGYYYQPNPNTGFFDKVDDNTGTVTPTNIPWKGNGISAVYNADGSVTLANVEGVPGGMITIGSVKQLESIVFQKQDNYWLSSTIVDATSFGPTGKEMTLPAAGKPSGVFGSTILFVANPSLADMAMYDLSIENSKGYSPKVMFTEAKRYDGLLTKAGHQVSGLWETKATATMDQFSDLIANIEPYKIALVAAEKNAQSGSDPREIFSKFELEFAQESAKIVTDFDVLVEDNDTINIYMGTEPSKDMMQDEYCMVSMDNPTPADFEQKHIWKKYVSISSADASGVTDPMINGINELMDGVDEIKISSNDPKLANKTVTFTLHVLNYDGSRVTKDFMVTFLKKVYEDVIMNFTSTVDYMNPVDEQISNKLEVTDLLAKINAVNDLTTWEANTAKIKIEGVESVDPSNMYKKLPASSKIKFIRTAATAAEELMPVNGMAVAKPATLTPIMQELAKMKVVYNADDVMAGKYGAMVTFLDANDLVINVVYVFIDIMAPNAYPSSIIKVTNAWSADLKTANVWAQLDATYTKAVYDIKSSFNDSPEFADLDFMSTEATPAFMTFGKSTGSTILTIDDASTLASHNKKTSLYPAKFGYVKFANFPVGEEFDIQFRSPIYESNPMWDPNCDRKLNYTGDMTENNITVDFGKIFAIDPSANTDTIQFFGTDRTGNVATDRDHRIVSVDISIRDPKASSASSNVGLVEVDDSTLPEKIMITAKPNSSGQYPALAKDATLHLVIKVVDGFGFTKSFELPFMVQKNQTN